MLGLNTSRNKLINTAYKQGNLFNRSVLHFFTQLLSGALSECDLHTTHQKKSSVLLQQPDRSLFSHHGFRAADLCFTT